MRRNTFYPRTVLLVATVCFFFFTVHAQQNIIADKNNTRPEADRYYTSVAKISSFSAEPNNGYIDIQWAALQTGDTRKFILEYSVNGRDFQTAGEVLAGAGPYSLKHHTFETPFMYRVKMEDFNGRYTFSGSYLHDVPENSPVRLYPTIVTTKVVNVIAALPVQRILVISGSGQQLFAQDISGRSENFSINLPASIGKGMYFMVFTGQGWKRSERFIVE